MNNGNFNGRSGKDSLRGTGIRRSTARACGAVAAPAAESKAERNDSSLRLWSAFYDSDSLSRALDASDRQLANALRQIEVLADDNIRLRKKAVRLASMVTHARHRAHHDQLTGLSSRRLLIDQFRQALALAQRQHKQVGFMMLDLDRFKAINDRLGHEAGDDVLRHVADCLRSCTRRSDTVCRYGGDEFVIMLPELDDREHILALATKIHARLRDFHSVQGASLEITTSIGVAVYPSDGQSFRELMKQADISMFFAKASTRKRARTPSSAAMSTANRTVAGESVRK